MRAMARAQRVPGSVSSNRLLCEGKFDDDGLFHQPDLQPEELGRVKD